MLLGRPSYTVALACAGLIHSCLAAPQAIGNRPDDPFLSQSGAPAGVLVPSQFNIVTHWENKPLAETSAYAIATAAILTLASRDPKEAVGASAGITYKDVKLVVQDLGPTMPTNTLNAVYGIFLAINEMAAERRFSAAVFTIKRDSQVVASIRIGPNAPTENGAPSALTSTLIPSSPWPLPNSEVTGNTISPATPNQLQDIYHTVVSWSGTRLQNWEFYLALSALGVKIAPLDPSSKSHPTFGTDLFKDIPRYEISVKDILIDPTSNNLLTGIGMLKMCYFALGEAGRKEGEGRGLQELKAVRHWFDGKGGELGQWLFELHQTAVPPVGSTGDFESKPVRLENAAISLGV